MATDKVLFRGCWGSRATDNYVMCVRRLPSLHCRHVLFDAAYRTGYGAAVGEMAEMAALCVLPAHSPIETMFGP